jgi:hypothetical protein
MMLVAFIPFGALFMSAMFKRKAAALASARSAAAFTGRS